MDRKRPPNFRSWILNALLVILAVGIILAICLQSVTKTQWKANRGHIQRIGEYFEALSQRGFEVDLSKAPEYFYKEHWSFGVVSEPEYLTWRMRENPNSDWVDYKWGLYPINDDTLAYLKIVGASTDGWWEKGVHGQKSVGSKSICLPLNAEALDVSRAVGLSLPNNYEILSTDQVP